MSPLLVDFLGSAGATIAAAVALALVREIRRVSRSVGESAAAVTQLTATVDSLVHHEEQTRERVAALEGAHQRALHERNSWRFQ